MKKRLAIFLALCIAVCITVPAFAADVPEDTLFTDAVIFVLDDTNVYYVRFRETVQGVSDAFCAQFLPDPDFPEELPTAVGKDAVQIVSPCEENGGRLELFLTGEVFSDLHLSGLLDAQGAALECTIAYEQCRWTYFSVSAIDDGLGFFVNLFTGEIPLRAMIWGDDFDLSQITEYCLVGDELYLPELPDALQNRATLTCDGVEVEENDDGTYTIVSGTGTVTYDVAGVFRSSKKFCVQTVEERRVFTARAAAKHPLVPAYFWLTALTVPADLLYPFGALLYPIGVLLGVVTLPLGCLSLILALRFGW